MSYLFAEQDRESLARMADVGLVVIPVGASEPHGPHLPSGTDSLLISHIAKEVAIVLTDDVPTLVAPTIPFGYSAYHLAEGPTISLSIGTLLQVMVDVLSSIAASGFRRMFILNGHGGNAELIQVAARAYAEQDEACLVGAGSYWSMAWDRLVAAGGLDDCRLPGHAGKFETAIVEAIRPDLVGEIPTGRQAQPDDVIDLAGRFYKDHRVGWRRRWPQGFTDDPSRAGPQLGAALLAAAIDGAAECLRQFYSDSL
ncbi:MAG TPA: creatininase family protein [Acidimicrobiia bacterium]|nr:creatininase family protein [Acidimicrobiia bacterium]